MFEAARPVTVEEVNALFKEAAAGALKESWATKPGPWCRWISRTIRASIVDALSTLVVDGTQLKMYAWYDNEWGYSSTAWPPDITRKLARMM